MIWNSKLARSRLTRAAFAGAVFALVCTATATPEGGLGIGTVEAKGKGGGKAKGQGGGGEIVKTSNAGGKGQSATPPRKSGQKREANAERKAASASENRAKARNGGGASKGADAYASGSAGSRSGTASQLKHRNAAGASESAFTSAAPNSNVGRIATYREAARVTLDKKAEIQGLDEDIADLRHAHELALSRGDQLTADRLDAEILGIESQRGVAAEDLYHLQAIEDEAYLAVGGPALDEHDYNVLRAMLGLE